MFLSRAYQLSGFSWLTCWIGTPRNTSALFTVTSNDMISPHNHTLLTPHACTLDRHETYDSRTLAVESIHLIQLGLSIELKLRPSTDVEKQCSTCTWRKKIRYNTICNTWYARIHCDLINKQNDDGLPIAVLWGRAATEHSLSWGLTVWCILPPVCYTSAAHCQAVAC